MKIHPQNFYDALTEKGIDFFTGVPDSLLKDICAYIDDHAEARQHIIAANEGNAIAIASGFYLRTGKIPLVYMQNSGLGNAINPLLSLCDPEIYAIPILMLIGWRGEPDIKDAIQHVKDGRIQENLLNALEIPFEVIGGEENFREKIDRVLMKALKGSRPVALLIRKGTFEEYLGKGKEGKPDWLTREEALEIVLNKLSDEKTIFVSTTGKTSRELYEIRERKGQPHNQDFLNVGAMGHCSSIALGNALANGGKRIVCLDGDGALIMHMGALAIIGSQKPKNFIHIIMNNGAHESVGGQPTVGFQIDICLIAQACGYKAAFKAETPSEVSQMIDCLQTEQGPALLEIRVNKVSRKNIGRPMRRPIENKTAFMDFQLARQ